MYPLDGTCSTVSALFVFHRLCIAHDVITTPITRQPTAPIFQGYRLEIHIDTLF